jgi:hypothetical protein
MRLSVYASAVMHMGARLSTLIFTLPRSANAGAYSGAPAITSSGLTVYGAAAAMRNRSAAASVSASRGRTLRFALQPVGGGGGGGSGSPAGINVQRGTYVLMAKRIGS